MSIEKIDTNQVSEQDREKLNIWFDSLLSALNNELGFDCNSPTSSLLLRSISIEPFEHEKYGSMFKQNSDFAINPVGTDPDENIDIVNSQPPVSQMNEAQKLRLYNLAVDGELMLVPNDGNLQYAKSLMITPDGRAKVSCPANTVISPEEVVAVVEQTHRGDPEYTEERIKSEGEATFVTGATPLYADGYDPVMYAKKLTRFNNARMQEMSVSSPYDDVTQAKRTAAFSYINAVINDSIAYPQYYQTPEIAKKRQHLFIASERARQSVDVPEWAHYSEEAERRPVDYEADVAEILGGCGFTPAELCEHGRAFSSDGTVLGDDGEPWGLQMNIANAVLHNKEVYVYVKNDNGIEPHLIKNGMEGLTLDKKPAHLIKEDIKAMLVSQLESIRSRLEATGTTKGDSPEFQQLRGKFGELLDDIRGTISMDKVQKSVGRLNELANAYYDAKKNQFKNSTRRTRFNLAASIKGIAAELRTNEEKYVVMPTLVSTLAEMNSDYVRIGQQKMADFAAAYGITERNIRRYNEQKAADDLLKQNQLSGLDKEILEDELRVRDVIRQIKYKPDSDETKIENPKEALITAMAAYMAHRGFKLRLSEMGVDGPTAEKNIAEFLQNDAASIIKVRNNDVFKSFFESKTFEQLEELLNGNFEAGFEGMFNELAEKASSPEPVSASDGPLSAFNDAVYGSVSKKYYNADYVEHKIAQSYSEDIWLDESGNKTTLRNPLSLSVSRTSVNSLSFAIMLKMGYKIDDILDPYKLYQERQICGRMAVDAVERGDGRDILETLANAMEKTAAYTGDKLAKMKSYHFTEFMTPENKNLMAMKSILKDLSQEYDKAMKKTNIDKNSPFIRHVDGVQLKCESMSQILNQASQAYEHVVRQTEFADEKVGSFRVTDVISGIAKNVIADQYISNLKNKPENKYKSMDQIITFDEGNVIANFESALPDYMSSMTNEVLKHINTPEEVRELGKRFLGGELKDCLKIKFNFKENVIERVDFKIPEKAPVNTAENTKQKSESKTEFILGKF